MPGEVDQVLESRKSGSVPQLEARRTSRRCEGRRPFEIAIGNLPCKAVRARSRAVAGNHQRAQLSTRDDESGDGLCAYPSRDAAADRESDPAATSWRKLQSVLLVLSAWRPGGETRLLRTTLQGKVRATSQGSGSQRFCLEGSRLFGWFVPQQIILFCFFPASVPGKKQENANLHLPAAAATIAAESEGSTNRNLLTNRRPTARLHLTAKAAWRAIGRRFFCF